MNRKQRRTLSKKVKKIDLSSLKRLFFRSLLITYNGEKEKVMDSQGDLRDKIDEMFMPKTINHLALGLPFINEEMNFDRTLDLSLFFCEHYVDILTEYVKMKNSYEKYILANMYEDANVVIQQLETIAGVSIWSTSQKLLLGELEAGIEGNKDLFAKLFEVVNRNIILSTLLEFSSYRAETNTSLNNYNEKVEKFLKHFDGIAYSYFFCKLNLQSLDFSEELKYVLQIDSQFSIIDLYNDVIEVIQRAIINAIEIPVELINRIEMLNNKLTDYRLTNVLLFLGRKVDFSYDKKAFEIIEKYSVQEYDIAIELLNGYLKEKTNDFQMWILFVKLHILTNREFRNNSEILNAIYSVYSLDTNCIQSKNVLYSFTKMYSEITWKYKLQSVTSRKLCCAKDFDKYITLSLLNEHTITPRFVTLLPDEQIKKQLEEELFGISPNTMRVLMPDEESAVREGCFRNKLFIANRLYNDRDYEKSLEKLKEIEYQEYKNISYVKEKIVRLSYLNYCAINDIQSAIHLIVDSYFENEYLIKRCNLNMIADKFVVLRNNAVFSDFDYLVFVYLSDKLDTKKHRISFSNFLDARNISCLEELLDLLTPDEKAIFVFEVIVSLGVLKRENRFGKTATQASKARVKILQKLIEINPKYRKKYLEEISLITTKKEINNKIRQVSQRKVYVDEEKIKLEKGELFEENFQKYLQLKALNKDIDGFDVTDVMTINGIKNIVNNMNEEIKRSTKYSQTILALKELVSDITYEFLRNEHYGLDTYLSSRIRHGYCKSQLTKELREAHLMLATIDDESMEFGVSQYWDEKIESYQESDYLVLKKILSDFTLDIEMKIQEIRRDWIRIKLTNDEVGMLDYTTFVQSILVVDKQDIVDFDMMYNTITNALWECTEEHLRRIRERINEELKPYYHSKLIELESRIKELENSSIQNVVHEVLNNITICKAKVANVMTEFLNIFYKDDVVYEDYTIDELVTTSIGIEKQIHARFDDVNVQKTVIGEKKLSGKSFSYLTEILVMLINNAVSHAGYADLSDLDLSLFLCMDQKNKAILEIQNALLKEKKNWSTDNLLVITVANNLAEDKDVKIIRSRVADIFEHAKDPVMLKKYSISEGGSGLYKIYKTINYNVSVPYVILYSVEENEFSLTLALDATQLLIQEGANGDSIC
jgi:hypothetical protein